MTQLRTYLLTLIGLVAGARAAGDLIKNGIHQQSEPSTGNAREGSSPAPGPRPASPQTGGGKATPTGKPVSTPGAEQIHTRDMSKVHGPIGYLKELFQRFTGDLCPAWAASLSFFSILAIGPVLLCGLAVLGYLIHDPAEAARQVERVIANLLPGRGASQTARTIIQQMNIEQSAQGLMQSRGTAGIIGLLSLFWSAIQIFLNATTPMNAAFRAQETRSFLKLRLVALGLLLGTGLLFLLSLLPSVGVQALNSVTLPVVGDVSAYTRMPLKIVLWVVGVVVNAAMFTLIYRYLPSPSSGVTWRSAAFAGSIVAVLWEIAKQAFALYLQRFGEAGYNKLYGSLGGLVGLIFWIYYSSMIMLLGAEIAQLYQDAQEEKQKRQKEAVAAAPAAPAMEPQPRRRAA